MMQPLRFSVLGIPQPKGSARAFPLFYKTPTGAWELDARTGKPRCRVVITSDNPNVAAWQKAVAKAAQLALGGVRLELTGGFEVEANFFFLRPKSHKKSEHGPHIVRPDGDKLLRAICDALKGIVYRDDGQITDHIARKRYAAAGTPARVDVTVTPVLADMPLFSFSERTLAHGDRPLIIHAEPRPTAPVVPW